MGEKTENSLNAGDVKFLQTVADNADNEEDHQADDRPRFPVISMTVLTVIFLIMMFVASYAVSQSAQYVPVMKVKGMDAIAESNQTVQAIQRVAAIYDMRYAIYGIIILIYAVIAGAILLVHHFRVKSWEDDDQESI